MSKRDNQFNIMCNYLRENTFYKHNFRLTLEINKTYLGIVRFSSFFFFSVFFFFFSFFFQVFFSGFFFRFFFLSASPASVLGTADLLYNHSRLRAMQVTPHAGWTMLALLAILKQAA